jgi:hypothetical protein
MPLNGTMLYFTSAAFIRKFLEVSQGRYTYREDKGKK